AEESPSSYVGSVLDAAVEQLWKAGIVVVAPSGNLGTSSMYFAPADDPFVISVGARDGSATAAFSSSGLTDDGFARPDLVSPGRHIASVLPAGSMLSKAAPSGNISGGYGLPIGTSPPAPQPARARARLLQGS